MTTETSDVLVVGAGPTGLLLAGDLAAAGVTTVVLERRDEESNLTRAFAVHARTLEQLDARGLADELVATGQTVDRLQAFEHADIDLSRLPTRFPYLLVTPQYHTERLLEGRLRSLGVEIERGAEVVGLRQDDERVEATVRTSDGGTRTHRASYLVGADGVRSTVRGALGLPFPGRQVIRSVILADVRLAEPPPDVLTVNAVREGLAFIAPFGDGWYRIIAWNRRHQVPDDEPVDLTEVREITRAALGTDFGMHDARWMSRFHNDERQVPSYRTGRVFLAGDAAHVHSPAGGLGMNTGLQDAANLSWKLAAAIGGRGGDALLDSYHDERYPVGRLAVRMSGGLLRLALVEHRPLRAARNLVGGVLTRVRPIADRAALTASGIGISYPAPKDAHPLAGRRAPDVRLADGPDGAVRLYEALRTGRFVVLGDVATDRFGWVGLVDAVAPEPIGYPLTLVRPDGYVAWASDETDPLRRETALRAALTKWCGTPARQPVGT